LSKTKIVIVGATSAIAEHCARLWITNKSANLVLIGRDAARMEPIAADLRVRSPGTDICVMQADFQDPKAIQEMVASVAAEGPVDIALIAHGSLPDQGACQTDLEQDRDALAINAISPVLYAEAFAFHMEKAGSGVIGIIGSVAGDRGRKSNYVYGAAKGLVSRYAQGMQHRFAGSGVSVVLIKPGPTDTPMTAHMKAKGVKLASVESVAQNIVDGIARRQAVVYAPGQWRLIMLVIRLLPSFIFNKLNI
jgi:short-subunit dehydrogenase